MKAKDLRIGNWVEFDGEESRIESISLGIKSGYVAHLECYGDLILFDHLEPIPLTEEWLFKFGFEKDETGFYKGGLWLERSKHETAFFVHFMSRGQGVVTLKVVNKVHELQNLYFSLCGEELEIKKD